jgi:hypothetical protein
MGTQVLLVFDALTNPLSQAQPYYGINEFDDCYRINLFAKLIFPRQILSFAQKDFPFPKYQRKEKLAGKN